MATARGRVRYSGRDMGKNEIGGSTHDNDVDDSQHAGENPTGDDDAPEWETEGLLRSGFLVEVAKDGDPDDHHEDS